MTGIWMSMRMMLGRSDLAIAMPAAPSAASRTVKPELARRSRKTPRRSSWSSTTRMRLVMNRLSEVGSHRQFHMERRALAQFGLHPDAATVHLDDLLRDRKPKSGTALGLGICGIDLMEL